jgi:non-specific protein-tyrosine kinase
VSVAIKDYLRIVFRWWWVWLISLGLALTSGYLYTKQQPRIFTARTTLRIGQGIANPNPDPQYINLVRSLASMYGDLAKRHPVTQPVVEKLQLPLSPDELSGRIDTRVLYDATLLEMVVYDTDPQRVADIANAVAEELVKQSPAADPAQESFIRAQMDDLQLQIERADDEIQKLRSAILSMTSATEISEAQARISELQQLKGDNQGTYAILAQALSQRRPNTIEVFERAFPASFPIGPRTTTNMVVAGGIGLALAAVTILLLEFMDDTVRWDGHVEGKVMGMPVLGRMPRLGSKDDRLVVRSAPHSMAAEMIRQLRTNIFLARPGQRLSTLLVTSPEPRDGKTLITANLAVSLAMAGRRVVLVDCDLRLPTLHEVFDLPNAHGLTDSLDALGAHKPVALESALLATSVPQLWLLPAGRPALDPMVLLSSPHLTAMLDELHDRADIVILDSPPVASMPDAVILSRYADATLLVAMAGGTSRRLLQSARNRLAEGEGGQLPGLVFNFATSARAGGYSYGYYRPRDGRRAARLLRLLPRRPGANGAQSIPSPSATNGHAIDNGQAPPNGDGQYVYVSLEDAATYLGVSLTTARRWCESGRLPATKDGRRWKISRTDLQKMAYRP